MESIISISFIDKKIDLECSSQELIKLLKKSKFVIRPPDFEGLNNTIANKFNPKPKKNYSISITGILPSGERTEVTDDDTYDKEISLFIVSYKKASRGPLFPDLKPKKFFTQSTLELPTFSNTSKSIPNINEFMSKQSQEIKDEQIKRYDSMISNLDLSLDKSLNDSVQNIILSASQSNIKKLEKIREDFNKFNQKIKEKRDNLKNILRRNSEKVNDITKKVEVNLQLNNKIPEVLFSFEQNKIKVEKDMNDLDPRKINIKTITIKSLSEKYPDEMLWLKEEDSDKNINFDQSDKSNEYPLMSDKLKKNEIDTYEYDLDLIIDEPKEMTEYKMIVSIINKENKQKLSDSLEIVVKTTKKGLSEEEINTIINNLKEEFKNYDLFLKNDEVIEIIKDNKGDKDVIKNKVKKIYDDNCKTKVDKLLDEFEEEMNYSKFVKREEVESEIINLNFDETEIKKWIEKKKPAPQPEKQPEPKPEPQPEKQPEPKPEPQPEKQPEPKPEKKPEPGPVPDDEKKVQDIIDKLDENYGINGILNDDTELKKIIREKNYKYDEIDEYVQENII